MDNRENYVSYSTGGAVRFVRLSSNRLHKICQKATEHFLRPIIHNTSDININKLLRVEAPIHAIVLRIPDPAAHIIKRLFTTLTITDAEITVYKNNHTIIPYLNLLVHLEKLYVIGAIDTLAYVLVAVRPLRRLREIRFEHRGSQTPDASVYYHLARQVPSLRHVYINQTRILATELRGVMLRRCLAAMMWSCCCLHCHLPADIWLLIYHFYDIVTA